MKQKKRELEENEKSGCEREEKVRRELEIRRRGEEREGISETTKERR